MDRRRFISIAGGAGLGLLLPYALYRSLAYGFGASHVNVRAYEKFGPEAALRAIAPVDQFYVTSSHGEPAVDVNRWSLTIDGLVTDPLHFDYDDIRKLAPYETTLTLECISNEIAGGLIDTADWRGDAAAPFAGASRAEAECEVRDPVRRGRVYDWPHGGAADARREFSGL